MSEKGERVGRPDRRNEQCDNGNPNSRAFNMELLGVIQLSEFRMRGKLTIKQIIPTMTKDNKQGDTQPLLLFVPNEKIRRRE